MEKLSPRKLLVSPAEWSLRVKVTLGIIIPMVLMLSIFMLVEYTRHRAVLLENLAVLASYNGKLIEDTLQHAMEKSDFAEIQRTLDSVVENENFRLVYLLDATGRVVVSPGNMNIGVQLSNLNPACQPCHKLPSSERPSGIVVNDETGKRVFRSMQPVANRPACYDCHDSREKLIGLLLTDISVAPFEASFVKDLRENLLLGGITILISAVCSYLVMGQFVIRRLKRVSEALSGFGKGKRDLRLSNGVKDEIGRLENDFNTMEQQIQQEEAANRILSENLRHQAALEQELVIKLINAQEDERKRVARELHDELGQALTGLSLQSQVIERFIHEDPERALKQLSQTRELIGKTTQQMYDLILALRPSVLDDLGLVAALKAHIERVFADSGIKLRLDSSGLRKRLPAAVETTLYRFFQEAVSNIVKHSQADRVTITLSRSDGVFDGAISDNGRGFDPENIAHTGDSPHGLGLRGMQERISQVGGTFEIHSAVGKGTNLKIRIPLQEDEDG